jgi:hypothetical protein
VPFNNHGNRSFTAMSVDKNAPPASGVYGLSDARHWIYVGETANIHADLAQHLRSPNLFLQEHAPSGFTFELSDAGQRSERRDRLVVELDPIGNRPIGRLSNRPERE